MPGRELAERFPVHAIFPPGMETRYPAPHVLAKDRIFGRVGRSQRRLLVEEHEEVKREPDESAVSEQADVAEKKRLARRSSR